MNFLIGLCLITILLSPVYGSEIPANLCHVPGCSCEKNGEFSDLIDVTCHCEGYQELKLGNPDVLADATFPPNNTIQLKIENCQKIELESQILNALPTIKNITLTKILRVILNTRIYDSRKGNGLTAHLKNFEIAEVRDLRVNRQAFEGLSIDGTFWFKEVFMSRIPSLAFRFDHVNDFSVFGSRFDRVSMWGFKLESCGDFNVLGMSRFFTLASQAIHLKCNKLMLAYNVFVNLHDSSLDVQFGFADIQGNTFETITGKPFVNLRPISHQKSEAVTAGGFVFRENKFAASPSLPIGALALPAFDNLDKDVTHVEIDENHFLCDCDKLSWYIGAMVHDHDVESLKKIGALGFAREIYRTSGKCLKCGVTNCEIKEQGFIEFAENALVLNGNNKLKCSHSGKYLPNQSSDNPNPKSSYDYERKNTGINNIRRPTHPPQNPTQDEEESSRQVKNRDFNSCKNLHESQFLIIFASVYLIYRSLIRFPV